MTKINSKQVKNPKSPQALFDILAEPSNFQKLMPDSVEKFEADAGSFIFGLRGMPEVRLIMDEKVPGQSVKLVSASSKLSFSLTAKIETEESGSAVSYHFEGKLNPMLKMMATKPLTNFLEELANRTTEL